MRLVYKPFNQEPMNILFLEDDEKWNNFTRMKKSVVDYVNEILPILQGYILTNNIHPSRHAWISNMNGYTTLLAHKMIHGKFLELDKDQDPELFYGFVLNQFDAVKRNSSAQDQLIHKLLEMYPNG